MVSSNQSTSKSVSTFVHKIIRSQSSGIFITLFALCAIFSLFSKAFLSVMNFNNILVQSSVTIITAVGMTFVISMGGIDISVGSVVALTGVVMGKAIQAGVPGIPAILIGLSVGALGGLCQWLLCREDENTAFYYHICDGRDSSCARIDHHSICSDLWLSQSFPVVWYRLVGKSARNGCNIAQRSSHRLFCH